MLTADYTMLSVEDIAKALNISKAAVYKTVKKNKELQKPIVKQDGRTFISEEGVEYLEIYYHKNIPEELYEILSKENIENLNEQVIEKESIIELDSIIKFKDMQEDIMEPLVNEVVHEPYNVEKVIDEISNSFSEQNININFEITDAEENNSIFNQQKDSEMNDFSKMTHIFDSPSEDSTTLEDISIANNKEIAINTEMIGLLKSYVEFLQTECDNKNKQLDNKDNIIKNMQTLLEKEQNTVSAQMNVEERCKAIDDKLLDLRSQLNERKERNNKSFFSKIKNLFK